MLTKKKEEVRFIPLIRGPKNIWFTLPGDCTPVGVGGGIWGGGGPRPGHPAPKPDPELCSFSHLKRAPFDFLKLLMG